MEEHWDIKPDKKLTLKGLNLAAISGKDRKGAHFPLDSMERRERRNVRRRRNREHQAVVLGSLSIILNYSAT